ncbi:MAG: methylamine utilization protein [Rubrivivax sp.]|nr:methylamine utilization protein [Rubrivivax sp.]
MPPSVHYPRPLRLVGAALLLAALPAAAASVEVLALGSDGKPLPETVVFLESPEARAAARPLPGVEIVQVERRFVPLVTVVTAGTSVSFPNRDTVRHHVYSFSAIKPFDLKLYAGTPANPVAFDKAGVAVLGCNIHDHMIAWVVVVDTPHFAVAGASGALRLDNVPPGSYRLRSWHAGLPPGAPAADEALVVPAGGARAQVKLALKAGAL